MLVNQYRLTSELTGEVITGTRVELERMGIDPDAVNLAVHCNCLLDQEWKCELLGKIPRPPKAKQGKKQHKLSIDDIAKLASEAGMHYGEYVALYRV